MATKQLVEVSIWQDRWFKKLSKDQKLVFLHLLTHPTINPAGMFEIDLIYLQYVLMIDNPEDVLKSLAPKIQYDESKDLIWITNYYAKNRGVNPDKLKRSIENTLKKFSSSFLSKMFAEHYNITQKSSKPFIEADLANPYGTLNKVFNDNEHENDNENENKNLNKKIDELDSLNIAKEKEIEKDLDISKDLDRVVDPYQAQDLWNNMLVPLGFKQAKTWPNTQLDTFIRITQAVGDIKNWEIVMDRVSKGWLKDSETFNFSWFFDDVKASKIINGAYDIIFKSKEEKELEKNKHISQKIEEERAKRIEIENRTIENNRMSMADLTSELKKISSCL